jgi:arylsulfatase A-like enzyme
VKYHSSNVHREQAHIPMVVRVPGVAPSVIDANTSSSYVFAWLLLHGPPPARAAAERAIREELAPLFRETEGAVLVELIGHRHLQTALRYPDYTVLYDLLGDAYRIYDKRTDPDEHYDLAPLRADLTERFRPRLDAYRRARFAGQRFVFIDAL